MLVEKLGAGVGETHLPRRISGGVLPHRQAARSPQLLLDSLRLRLALPCIVLSDMESDADADPRTECSGNGAATYMQRMR